MRCCVGGHGERTNKEVVEVIRSALDDLLPAGAPHSRDRRCAIDPTQISSELGWQPRHSFEEGLAATMRKQGDGWAAGQALLMT
jgi:dTDP-glucose 4,6-dehydratase